MYEELFEVVKDDDVPEDAPVRYYKKTGESIQQIVVKCKECDYTGKYNYFTGHYRRQHLAEKPLTPGPRGQYENGCIWP